jgi:hypothetical protein
VWSTELHRIAESTFSSQLTTSWDIWKEEGNIAASISWGDHGANRSGSCRPLKGRGHPWISMRRQVIERTDEEISQLNPILVSGYIGKLMLIYKIFVESEFRMDGMDGYL